MVKFDIGIDHGTGGCKVTCINTKGEKCAESYVSYPSYYDKPRWVEQDPADWINAAIEGVNKALKNFSQKMRNQVKGISFSAPHHVAVLLDKDKNVIRRSIMWNDQRTELECAELNNRYGDNIIAKTNHKVTPTWTLPQLLWIKKNEPETFAKIEYILFEKDYVRYRFSGEMATDYIEAEGTMVYDVHKQEWADDLLSYVLLDKSVLPRVYEPMDQSGMLTKEMAEKLNLPAGIPIFIGTADTAAEVYGSGAIDKGDGVVKLATAGNFSILSDQRQSNLNLTGYQFPIKGLYYLNSATNFAAASFRWFKENFYNDFTEKYSDDNVYAEIDKRIAGINPGADGLIFHPYLNGERSPYRDPNLKGSFFGINANSTRSHFARAVLEGVGFSIKDASLEFDDIQFRNIKLIGGGSKSKIWAQIMADILGVH